LPVLNPMTILGSKRLLIAAILLFGLLAMTARSATDPDLWWHLRTGQWMVENGRVAHHDHFSFTRGGSPWVSHEWLAEIVFYELWSHAGPGMLIVFSSIVTTAGFLLLYWRCPGKPHWAAALTVLGAAASAPSWGTRPQMFTFALASLLLWLLEGAEQRPRMLLAIPPLFLLWLNLHAGFALGPALLVLYALGLVLETAAGTTPWSQSRPIVSRVLGITLFCMVLVPLNPSGSQLYRYPLETLRSTGMRKYIVEWFSPNFHQWLYVPFLLTLLLLFLALAYSHTPFRGRVLLPLLFTTIAALDAVRHIPIFILVAIPVVSAAIPNAPSPLLSRPQSTPAAKRATFALVALILLASFAILRWTELDRDQQAREDTLFPELAVAFLQTSQEPERLFTYYDWGGYAIWKLGKHYQVFADGRADLYGDDILTQCVQTVTRLHTGWEQVLDSWNVQTILVPPSTALAQALSLDPRWNSAYRDRQAVVFVRVHPQQVRLPNR
jgi:hypothetical protein